MSDVIVTQGNEELKTVVPVKYRTWVVGGVEYKVPVGGKYVEIEIEDESLGIQDAYVDIKEGKRHDN